MDDKTYYSTKAETRVIYELTKAKYHVFSQVSGKAPFDLVAYRDNVLLRVSVKSVVQKDKHGSFVVQLKTVRSNKTENKITTFDNTSCDLLAVYLDETDQVCWLPTGKVKATSAITLATTGKKSSSSNNKHFVDDFLSLDGC